MKILYNEVFHIQDIPVHGIVCFVGEREEESKKMVYDDYFFPYAIRLVVLENGACFEYPLGPCNGMKFMDELHNFNYHYTLFSSIHEIKLKSYAQWMINGANAYERTSAFIDRCKHHGVFIEKSAELFLEELKSRKDGTTSIEAVACALRE